MNEPISKRKIVGGLRHRLVLLLDELKMAERRTLQNALALAEEAHDEQFRPASIASAKRGLPFIAHPMRVALILLEELEMKDTIALAGALLHDVVETRRKNTSIADIERSFGRSVAMMVSILTMPEIPPGATEEEVKSKVNIFYQRIRQASVSARIVKIASRLDTVREAAEWLDLSARRMLLDEATEVYLPLARDTDGYLMEELEIACEQLEESLKGSPA